MVCALTRSAAALALVILSVGQPGGPVLAADERPDLKIEFVGVPIASNQRDVQVKVTNVSAWWADETKLTVETVPRRSGDPVETKVENLDPGQSVIFKYTLAADCNGHVVKAEVSSAKNYEGVRESNDGNNKIEGAVCQAQSQPAAKPAPKPDPPATGDQIITNTAAIQRSPAAVEAAEPDLRIDAVTIYTNPAGVVNDLVVRYKVTNIGSADAPLSSGKLEFNAPATEPDVILAIPALARNASFEGYAQLPAPCDGHIVQVAVYAPGETNFADNTHGPVKLCPDKPEPFAIPAGLYTPILTEPVQLCEFPGYCLLPQHMWPGRHELEFEPSALRSLSRDTLTGYGSYRGVDGDSHHPDSMFVGWDGGSAMWDFRVSQTAVNFNLARLHEVGRFSVVEAHLSFVEHPRAWTRADGGRADVPGCVTEISYATNDWGVPPEHFMGQDLMFRDRHLTFKVIAERTVENDHWRAFDVTGHVMNQVLHPDDVAWWFGYVLHGQIEKDVQVARGACMSRISSMRLWVTYDVTQ